MDVAMMGGVMITCVDVGAWGRMRRVRWCVLLLMAVLVCGCARRERSRSRVDRASVTWEPEKLELVKGFNSYVRVGKDVRDCEVGVIQIANGERVKFWFVSHHQSHDWGCTKFLFSDGTVRYLDGAFCCEVQLASEQPKDRAGLNAFLDTREGINPGPQGS